MLERGRTLAKQSGVSGNLTFTQGDFNTWQPERSYDAVVANQALHHVVTLEGLFANIRASLRPDGIFVTSDMIGRNGHMRWPEALEIVHEFWRQLPESYRYNRQLKRYEELYQNWDCSTEGFEGIRAQDILPLPRRCFTSSCSARLTTPSSRL
jgi:2-polyprenyl-3-methyl-5-hydroxy-6-metoxy-1,4-benzoquinol methylase